MDEQARRDAKAAEEAVTRGERLGPLHGVPISIKDLVDVKGVPTRHGSAIFADNPPAAPTTSWSSACAPPAPSSSPRHRRRSSA